MRYRMRYRRQDRRFACCCTCWSWIQAMLWTEQVLGGVIVLLMFFMLMLLLLLLAGVLRS
jgi:hypothetical protein